jgi:sugar-specific transcriptional regulator TrmB
MTTVTNKFVLEVLKNFGLTDKESEVYIYLAKSCIQKAGNISKSLRMHKAQVYRILRNLRRKGLVKSTFEVPMRFEAVPFEGCLDLIIKAKKEEATFLEGKRDELVSCWNSINIACPAFHSGMFMIVKGRNNLYSMIFQMIERAEREVLGILDSLGLMQAVQMGLLDVLEKTETSFRFLTEITKENLQMIKPILEMMTSKNKVFTVNHVGLVSGICPRFIIRDDKEAIIFLSHEDASSTDRKHENGIWTNMPAVFYTKAFFEELWHKSTKINKRILELEAEKLSERTR